MSGIPISPFHRSTAFLILGGYCSAPLSTLPRKGASEASVLSPGMCENTLILCLYLELVQLGIEFNRILG